MPIYRFTIRRMLRAPSTWIYLFVSLAVFFFTFVMLNTFVIDQVRPQGNKEFLLARDLPTLATGWKQVITFLLPAIAVIGFIAVKTNQIFRNDIDEGTLLILISKPIGRNRIWFEKWLAFMSVLCTAIPLMIWLPHLVFLINGWQIFWHHFVWSSYLVLVSLLLILVVSSIALCISMAVGAGGTVALVFLFVLSFMFGPIIDTFVALPGGSISLGLLAEGFLKVKDNLPDDKKEHYQWLVDQTKDRFIWNNVTERAFDDTLESIYHQYIPGGENYSVYGADYNPKAEQEIFAQIAEHNAADKYPVLTEEQIELVTHAYYLSETLRVSEKQGYLVLFTGTTVAGSYDTAAQTDVMPLFTIGSLIQTHISLYLDESQYQNYRDQVSKKRIMKYLNVIDHLPFLWRNMLENSNYDSLAGPNSALQLTDNPRVVEHFYLQDDQEGKKVYRIDLDKLESAPQIVNYWVILGFYCVLGVGLLFLNWYLFKKHDFA